MIEKYHRGLILAYEELKAHVEPGQIGVDDLFFGTRDESLDSNVRIDKKIQQPFAVAYRDKDNQSQVAKYKNGTGEILEVPRASVKTPVGEDLKDSLVWGLDGNSRFAQNAVKLFTDIATDHLSNHNVTKWKQAIDVVRTGVFIANGLEGKSIGLSLDFERDAANELTYDFTGVGATFDEAIEAMHTQLDAKGARKQNRILLCGRDWLNNFSSDTLVREFLDSNSANILLEQNMMVPLVRNTAHLYALAVYRAPGSVSNAIIAEFNPDTDYFAYDGATAAPWVPDDEAVMFVLGEQRWKVLRGIDVFSENGQVVRESGDVVFDAYAEKDPIGDMTRSTTRHFFLPGNIDHTVRSTGTFA